MASKTFFSTWALNSGSSDTKLSMCHIPDGVLAVGDTVITRYWTTSENRSSAGKFMVTEVRGSAYGGTIGNLSNDTNLIVEGNYYRFTPVLGSGDTLDIRSVGVPCVEGTTGWHSRFSTILAWAKNKDVVLTGAGVMSCTETVYLDRVITDFRQLRFQGGTFDSTTGVRSPTFYTTAQTNTAITFTLGSPVQINMTAHGLVANDSFMLGTNEKLPGSLAPLTTYYVKTVLDANSFTISSTAGGAALNITTAGSGNFYLWRGGTQSGITTQDILTFEGKVQRLGIIVRCATNGSNRDYGSNFIRVWGDGNFDRTTPPSCICVRHEGDDSPNAKYEYVTNYGYIGVGIQGPSEKHELSVKGIYQRHLVHLLPSSSADTLRVRINGTNCQHWYTESEGTDTSVIADLSVESRDDPASDAGSEGAYSPAIYVRNGKCTDIRGEIRANNGYCCILVAGYATTSGSSLRTGADTVRFNVRLVHGYGIALWLKAVRYVSGIFTIKNWDDPNGVTATNAPCVLVERVTSAAGLKVDGYAILNNVGVQIGSTSGLYPRDANLGQYSMDMGSLIQWNTDGTERTGSSGNPTTLNAWEVQKMKAGFVDFSGSRGLGSIGANAIETATIRVCANMKQYTITKHASAVVDVGLCSQTTTGLTIV